MKYASTSANFRLESDKNLLQNPHTLLMGTRPSWVRTDTFFAMDGEDKIVGIIDLRHTLNDFLADLGNCGCSVRPSQRQKGYAGQMLGQVLDRAKEVGLTALDISVERENLPSVKVIKRNGGVYQRSFTHEGQQADIYAFRI